MLDSCWAHVGLMLGSSCFGFCWAHPSHPPVARCARCSATLRQPPARVPPAEALPARRPTDLAPLVCLQAHVGVIWAHAGLMLDSSGLMLGSCWAHVGLICAHAGLMLDSSGLMLGSCWTHLGSCWAHAGLMLDSSGLMQGSCWTHLGSCRAHVGLIWAHAGLMLDSSGLMLGSCWPHLGLCWTLTLSSIALPRPLRRLCAASLNESEQHHIFRWAAPKASGMQPRSRVAADLQPARSHFRAVFGGSVPTKMPQGAILGARGGGGLELGLGWVGLGMRLGLGWVWVGFGFGLGSVWVGWVWLGFWSGLAWGWAPRIATQGHSHCEHPKLL